MNIVFIGTSKFAVPALDKLTQSKHRVMAVVTQPDRPRGRGLEVQPSPVKEVAVARNLYLYQPEDVNTYEFLRDLRALSPDVIAIAAYGQKLGREILQLPRYYCVNIHPSLLPRYRGPSPVACALLNGDTLLGVSIIKVTEKMDAGPILGIAREGISPEATTLEAEDVLANLGGDLLLEALNLIEQGAVLEIPQDERQATYARKFEKDDGRIDWRKSGFRIHNFVRALQPFPIAYTSWNRTRLAIHKVRAERRSPQPNSRPGIVSAAEKDRLHVFCGDGEISILELQPESKRKMTVAEFVNGHPIKAGDFLG